MSSASSLPRNLQATENSIDWYCSTRILNACVSPFLAFSIITDSDSDCMFNTYTTDVAIGQIVDLVKLPVVSLQH